MDSRARAKWRQGKSPGLLHACGDMDGRPSTGLDGSARKQVAGPSAGFVLAWRPEFLVMHSGVGHGGLWGGPAECRQGGLGGEVSRAPAGQNAWGLLDMAGGSSYAQSPSERWTAWPRNVWTLR